MVLGTELKSLVVQFNSVLCVTVGGTRLRDVLQVHTKMYVKN